eukprot:scaffold38270_cov61-Phaeocystis_antarctica.AAC.1
MGDGRVKHEVCPICVKLKVPTTYWCCVNCPGNPAAWKRHSVYHKEVKKFRNRTEDGGVTLVEKGPFFRPPLTKLAGA